MENKLSSKKEAKKLVKANFKDLSKLKEEYIEIIINPTATSKVVFGK